MEPWIFITIGAALAQSLRFMLQKQLKTTALSTAGTTFARSIACNTANVPPTFTS